MAERIYRRGKDEHPFRFFDRRLNCLVRKDNDDDWRWRSSPRQVVIILANEIRHIYVESAGKPLLTEAPTFEIQHVPPKSPCNCECCDYCLGIPLRA